MLRLRFIAIVLGLLIPASTLAAPPPPVTGLSGEQQAHGEVRIEWEPSQDIAVVRYRLYYGAESILESGGMYDDFEETQGTENVYVFVTPPTTGALYVTVLAVNNAGEESESFAEEVKVNITANTVPRLETSSSSEATVSSADSSVLEIPQQAPSSGQSLRSQANIPVYTEPVSDGRVHLLLAEALSPMQVKLTFSEPVTVEPDLAPQAFSIESPGGKPLRITQVLLSEHIVVADTEMQQKGLVYNVKLREPLRGTNNEPLDATDRTAFFTGHDQGTTPAAVQPSPGAPYDPRTPGDVMDFALRATPEAGGTYTVTARWQADITRGDIAHYVIRQSLDGGRTFSEPQMVPMDVAGVELQGVQPGSFGISLHVVNVYGGTSGGVFDSVMLPGSVAPPVAAQEFTPSAWPPPTVFADVLAQPQTRRAEIVSDNRLSQSGIGLLVIGYSLMGACVGWRKAKKLKMEN